MFYKISVIFIIFSIECNGDENLPKDWSDLNRTTPQLIESRNFKSETHFITTSDGYILQLFRIINPYLKNRTQTLKPIILQHGFCSRSDEFLISKQGHLSENGLYIEDGQVITDCSYNTKLGKTLGFVLSACGYDVWLSNIRGNKYTTNHTFLNPSDYRFWKFSLDQLSQIDLPAIINYVGAQTKNQRIGYIGYSMGTTIMFALMSAQPSYSAIIDPFIAIAPVVYMSKVPQMFLIFKYLYPLFRAIPGPLLSYKPLKDILINLFGVHEFPGRGKYVSKMATHLIEESSTVVLSHFLQIMAKNCFTSFDWGPFDNYLRYGTTESPKYSLGDITSNRIALIQTKYNDLFSDFEDLSRLKNELKVKPLLDYWMPDPNWTHSDYLFNENIDIYLISVVMKLLKQSND